MSKNFAADVKGFVEAAEYSAIEAVRAIALEVLRRVVMRSPVGNPELWAANKHVMERRVAYLSKPTKSGRRRSPRYAAKKYPLIAPEGYVGGRFRGAWQVSLETLPAPDVTTSVDPKGDRTIQLGAEVIKGYQLGLVLYIVNNTPYAERLEYGWSKQAPNGMVRLTVAEFQGIVVDACSGLKAKKLKPPKEQST